MRQDMLTMQMIKIMDRLWLKSGLDLKIITFACLATGPKKGMGKIEYHKVVCIIHTFFSRKFDQKRGCVLYIGQKFYPIFSSRDS